MKIILLGAPNAGKGTYARKIKEIYNLTHVSTGDLLRNAIANNHPIGAEAKELIDQGSFVPDEMIVNLLKEELEKLEGGIILDGFPRTLSQAELLKDITDINAVLKFDINDEVAIRRGISRVICKDCGGIFNLLKLKPKEEGICDHCQGELYRRDDDTEETIKSRLKTYYEQTAPLEDFYKNLGILKSVDANLDMSHPDFKVIKNCQEILDKI